MGYDKQNISGIFAANAMANYEQVTSPISIPKIREARDMVYNGSIDSLDDNVATVNYIQSPRNKKRKQRRVSPFTIVLLLLGGAVSSVLYIGNILSVGNLMAQINLLQTKHQQILNEQELLKARINRLSGLERIQQVAHDQLGLQNPRQLPVWIEIDPERVNEVKEVFQRQMDHKR